MTFVGNVELSNMAAIPGRTLEDLSAKTRSLDLIFRPQNSIKLSWQRVTYTLSFRRQLCKELVSGSKRLNLSRCIKDLISMIQAKTMKATVRIERKDG